MDHPRAVAATAPARLLLYALLLLGLLLGPAEISRAGSAPTRTVYVGSEDHNLYALDTRTGHLRWRFPTGGGVVSSPAVAAGVVYVGSHDENVYALDARTGRERWHFPTGDYVDSSPAVAAGVVYVGSDDHNLYALDARTGHLRWRFQTGDAVHSSPTIG